MKNNRHQHVHEKEIKILLHVHTIFAMVALTNPIDNKVCMLLLHCVNFTGIFAYKTTLGMRNVASDTNQRE